MPPPLDEHFANMLAEARQRYDASQQPSSTVQATLADMRTQGQQANSQAPMIRAMSRLAVAIEKLYRHVLQQSNQEAPLARHRYPIDQVRQTAARRQQEDRLSERVTTPTEQRTFLEQERQRWLAKTPGMIQESAQVRRQELSAEATGDADIQKIMGTQLALSMRKDQAKEKEEQSLLQAKSEFFGSSRGQELLRNRHEQQKNRALQEETIKRKELVAVHGRLAGSAMGLRREFLAATPAIAAAAGAMYTMFSFAGKASPTHMTTLWKSLDILQAKIGGLFLPAIDVLSRSIQDTSNTFDKLPGSAKSGAQTFLTEFMQTQFDPTSINFIMDKILPGSGTAWGLVGQTAGAIGRTDTYQNTLGHIDRAIGRTDFFQKYLQGSWLDDALKSWTGFPDPPERELNVPWHGGVFSSAADWGTQTQVQISEHGVLTHQHQQLQLQHLQEAGVMLQGIKENTDKMAEIYAQIGWRAP